ncbi:GNAT family N-acetyltransferase [Brucella sp. BO3]|uniref:GNAT family N-acetyltransferase n=1 Tax=unclassified Brucella TaxID=2632610 RepID=UPI00084F9595|nr:MULTISPECIES: GNAT family N-acetyltransferase [unclassified Brucella]OEI82566.1 GCN5 family acetyltransferase [Brucella sp. B13-0095]QMV26252.1 GNAT family N-acetyltransferase [Brucella sp. BO3]QTN98800.1 GNAT family N-acetyltransferase [Brucella sp. 458]
MPEKLKARITHLEMTARSPLSVPVPTGLRLAIIRASDMPVHYYRYLYEQVGRQHHWMLRRVQSDSEVAEAIHAETTEIHVLYADGCPAGFVELELSAKPDTVEILYFGLIADFQGRGLARFFLNEAISAAWAHSPQKVTIHTNTLDSPRALQLYQKMGFVPVAWSEEEVEQWL